MPTVIDELIVKLGLDTSKFKEGERDTLESLKKTREAGDQFSKSAERQAMKVSDAFSLVRKGALGIMGAFVGGEAASFVNQMINMDAATGRFAKTIGTSVANLSTWQGMIRLIGGDAMSATSALSALQQEIESVRQGGGQFEGGFASLMNQSGASIRDDADTMLRKIQGFISGKVASGQMRPEEATTYLRRVPGMNQDMVNLLLGDFKRIADAVKTIGTATDQTVGAAQKLQETFNGLVLAIENFVRKINPIIVLMTKPMNELSGKDAKGAADTLDSITGIEFEKGGFMDRMSTWMLGRSIATGGADAPGGGGGTRGDRNNNPGNMKDGQFARSHGAIGRDDKGFAIFPDTKTGSDAQIALVQGSSYRGLTLDQFASKYAEGSPAWARTVGQGLGIGPGDVVNNKDPRLIDAIRRAEGTGARTGAGARINNSRTSSSTSSSEVSIGKIEVNAPNATDADGVASEIGSAMKRQSLLAPANYGLQ